MKGKTPIVIMIMMLVLSSTFAGASVVKNEPSSSPAPLGDTEVIKYADEYDSNPDHWVNWPDTPHAMHCDNYWNSAEDDYIYYKFTANQSAQDLSVGAEFKAEGWPWNGGPDLDVKNQITGSWDKIKQGMGKPSTFTWAWYNVSNDYISSSGDAELRILCASGCHAYLYHVGISYTNYTPPPDRPPNKPTVEGFPEVIYPGTWYQVYINCVDPDYDKTRVYIESDSPNFNCGWTDWYDWYNNGFWWDFQMSRPKGGSFYISFTGQDEHGLMSEKVTFSFMVKSRSRSVDLLFYRFLERFPLLERLLQNFR